MPFENTGRGLQRGIWLPGNKGLWVADRPTDRPYFNYKMPKGILSSFELIPSAINSSAPSVAVDYARLPLPLPVLLHLLRKSFLAIRQDTHAHFIPS